VQPVQ